MDFLYRLLAADGLDMLGQDGVDGRRVGRRRVPHESEGGAN
jgi:hypothetical protein